MLGQHGEVSRSAPSGGSVIRRTLVTLVSGRHDVLNDLNHRTVAATVVLFLERLRLGADLPVIARSAA